MGNNQVRICGNCGESFKTYEELRKHRAESHRSQTILQANIPSPDQDGFIDCLWCEKEFEGYRGIGKHVGGSHSDRKREAVIEAVKENPESCGSEIVRSLWWKSEEGSLTRDIRSILEHHSNIQNLAGDNERPSWKYVEESEEVESFDCLWCGKGFNSRKGLGTHIGSVHPNGKKDTVIDYIKKNPKSSTTDVSRSVWWLPDDSNANQTIQRLLEESDEVEAVGSNASSSWVYVVSEDVDHTCETCGDTFDSARALAGHKNKHSEKSQKKIRCEFCGKHFKAKGLGTHKRYNHPDELAEIEEPKTPDDVFDTPLEMSVDTGDIKWRKVAFELIPPVSILSAYSFAWIETNPLTTGAAGDFFVLGGLGSFAGIITAYSLYAVGEMALTVYEHREEIADDLRSASRKKARKFETFKLLRAVYSEAKRFGNEPLVEVDVRWRKPGRGSQ